MSETETCNLEESTTDIKSESSPTDLFDGIESCFGIRREIAVTGDHVRSNVNKSFEYTLARSLKDVELAMDISTNIDANSNFVALKTKMDFVNKLQISETSVTILIKYTHTEVLSATNVKKKDGIIFPTEEKDFKKFYQDYGDSYIREATVGGELFAAYIFHGLTKKERTKIISQLEAKSIVGGGFNAAVEAELENYSKISNVKISFVSSVIGFDINPPSKLSEVIKVYDEIKRAEPKNPNELLSYIPESYLHVPNVDGALWEKVEKNSNHVRNEVIPLYQRACSCIAQEEQTLNLYQFWYNQNGTKLMNEYITKLTSNLDNKRKNIKTIKEKLNLYQLDTLQEVKIEDDVIKSFDQYYEPCVNVTSKYVCGSSSGENILKYHDPIYFVQNFWLITALQVRTGNVMDRIEISYNTPSGSEIIVGGGNGGDERPECLFPVAIKSIRGWSAAGYAYSFCFDIKDKPSIWFGVEQTGDPASTVNIELGDIVIGFAGREESSCVRRVEVIIAKFEEPKLVNCS